MLRKSRLYDLVIELLEAASTPFKHGLLNSSDIPTFCRAQGAMQVVELVKGNMNVIITDIEAEDAGKFDEIQ